MCDSGSVWLWMRNPYPSDNSVFSGVTSSETLKPQEALPAKRLRSAAPRCEHTYLNVTSASNLIVGTKTFSFFFQFSPAFFFSPWLMRLTFSTLCIPENEATVFPRHSLSYIENPTEGPGCSGRCVCGPRLSHRCEGCQGWWINTRWFEDLTLLLSWRQSGVIESCRRVRRLVTWDQSMINFPAAEPPCGSCRNTWIIHPIAIQNTMSRTWSVKCDNIYIYIYGQVQAVNIVPHQLAISWC